MQTATTTVCLVRHGETDWNVERRLQGHLDIPLNANGHAQAARLADALKGQRFDALVASDLARTRQTAAPLSAALGLPISLDAHWRERHYGALQGLTLDEAPSLAPEPWRAYREREIAHPLEGGESLADFAGRVHAALEGVERGHAGRRVLVVCHGGVLDIVWRIASAEPLDTPRKVAIPNAALNTLSHRAGRWQVDNWASLEHLDGALDEL
ncbi:histidine phosphatase family protein [Crenobacter caeni]|uniref:Histidine phosphatase family protein n=1 Tax=Crenobacter caeni TaxID=2705474 RepID=A0A6B2KPV6_9NEIS|nr:histidine phosphatase family protein [Crenobacter caeni]NDV12262.1 histidine phosphatase family protein [Crenobacter caeni]